MDTECAERSSELYVTVDQQRHSELSTGLGEQLRSLATPFLRQIFLAEEESSAELGQQREVGIAQSSVGDRDEPEGDRRSADSGSVLQPVSGATHPRTR